MRKQLLLFLICLQAWVTYAQAPPTASLSSPYDAVTTHLLYLQEETYDEKLASRPFMHEGISEQEAIESAIMLKQIWDGQGLYIDVELIPREFTYYDSARNSHQYVVDKHTPSIYLQRVGSEWMYSKATIKVLDDIHDEVFPLGTDKLLDLLPEMGTRKLMGLYLYQYIGIFILILLSIITHKLLSFMFGKALTSLLVQAGYERLADRFLLPVARPISLFVVILLVQLFLPVLQLPAEVNHWVLIVAKVLLPLFGTIVFYRMADVLAVYLQKLATRTESTLDDQLVPLVRKTLKTFVVAIGTLFILENLEIPIIPLLTGLSIGGLAFALAAQDTIKNFFGSLMIFIDRPFQIGDWITSGTIDGSVEEVGFRSSRIRTFRNSLMYVPNGKLADSTIDNHGMRQYRRFFTQIALTYDTPPEAIEVFVDGLHTIVKNHPDTRKDYYNIYLNDMASFSLNVMFYIFFSVPNWPAELKARQEILLEILKLARELGINFAFPTQTLHMENFPGQPSLSPEYMSKGEMQGSLDGYFKGKEN